MVNFILYSRSYCHLCEDMQVALESLRNQFSFNLSVIDIDQETSLLGQYDELVPVLVGDREGQVTQLCHYFLDVDKVKAFLTGVAR